jgi:hypothetical protein
MEEWQGIDFWHGDWGLALFFVNDSVEKPLRGAAMQMAVLVHLRFALLWVKFVGVVVDHASAVAVAGHFARRETAWAYVETPLHIHWRVSGLILVSSNSDILRARLLRAGLPQYHTRTYHRLSRAVMSQIASEGMQPHENIYG